MTETRELLRDIAFDPELSPGARNAVESCLRIQPHEKVTLITDRACQEIGASLAHEMERLGIRYEAFILEDLAPRPLKEMPQAVLDDMETSDVSIFAVKAQGQSPLVLNEQQTMFRNANGLPVPIKVQSSQVEIR